MGRKVNQLDSKPASKTFDARPADTPKETVKQAADQKHRDQLRQQNKEQIKELKTTKSFVEPNRPTATEFEAQICLFDKTDASAGLSSPKNK